MKRGQGVRELGFVAVVLAFFAFAQTAEAAVKPEQLQVKVRAGGQQVLANVTTGGTPVKLTAKLNRKNVSGLFAFRPSAAGPAVLGRSDGLRYGRNRLLVTAVFGGGKTRTRTAIFRLKTRRPLADAGPGRRISGGDSLRLSAKGSLARGKGKLRYRWKIVGKPPKSKARLKNPRAMKPRLITDRGGVYRVRLSVRKGRGPVGTDLIQVDAADPKMTRAGTFVSTTPFGPGAAGGPATGLQIFNGGSAGSYPIGRSNPGPVVAFFFDRATMGLIQGPVYTDAGAAAATKLNTIYKNAVSSTGRTPLVIQAGNNYGTMDPNFQAWLFATLNVSLQAMGSPSSFAVGGVSTGARIVPPAALPASIHFVSGDTEARGRFSGQILPDSSQNWSFVPSNLPAFGTTSVPFDTATPEGTIELAGETYPQGDTPPGCPAAGGFRVLGVGATAPDLMKPVDRSVTLSGRTFENGDTFWTNACAFGSNSAAQESRFQAQAMLALLNTMPTNPSAEPLLIFVQSVGNVAPSNTEPDGNNNLWLDQVATQIGTIGGSEGTFLGLFGPGTTGYSLIGQNFYTYGSGGAFGGGTIVSPAEAATNATGGKPARLVGSMRRDPAGRLIPSIVSAADGSRATAFKQPLPQSELVRQVNTSTWKRTPFPGQGNAAWLAALQDIAAAAQLVYDPDDVPCYRPAGGVSDVRSNYCGGVPDGQSADTYWKEQVLPAVQAFAYSQNSEYTAEDLAAVKAQLAIEFPMVDAANESANVLAQTFSAIQSDDAESITDTYVTAVQKAAQDARLRAQPTSLGWIGEIFDLAAAFSSFFNAEVSDVLWVTSASLANESNLATDGSGNSIVTGLTGSLSGTPEEAAGAISAQLGNQVISANEVRFAVADAIVSDWGRLQKATEDLEYVPKTEAIADSVNGIRFSGIRFVWNEMLQATSTLYNVDDSNINAYNPPGNGLQPAYDKSFVNGYGCWLSGTGIFKDGESIEDVYSSVPQASVYSDPHNLFSWQRWNSYSPWVLTVGGKNPSGTNPNPAPAPAAQYYATFLPDSIVTPFTDPLPTSGSSISPVVNGGPPGLGYYRTQMFDRLAIQRGDNVSCGT